MKAAVLEKNNVVNIKEVPTPEIKEDEVLVQVKYSGVCGSHIPRPI